MLPRSPQLYVFCPKAVYTFRSALGPTYGTRHLYGLTQASRPDFERGFRICYLDQDPDRNIYVFCLKCRDLGQIRGHFKALQAT